MNLRAWATSVVGLFAAVPTAAQDVELLRQKLRTIERLAVSPKPSEAVERDLATAVAEIVKARLNEPASMFWLGDILDRQGKFDDAMNVWKRSLPLPSLLPDVEINPIKAKAAARVSQGLLAGNDGEGAEAFALQSMDLDPRSGAGPAALLESSLRTGKLTAVVETLRQAADRQDAAPAVRVVYHDALAKIGEWDLLNTELERLGAEDRRPEDYHHFKARIAEIERRPLDAFLYHCLASVGGAESASTTLRSRDFVDKMRFQEEAGIPKTLRPYVLALNALDRADTRPDGRTAGIQLLTANGEPQRLAGRYLQARCDAAAGNSSVEEKWRELISDYPYFAPAYCGLAEAIETRQPDSKETATLLVKAEELSPSNGKVREHFRMGARWRPTTAGAVAVSVEPDTAWARYPLHPGDEVVELDDKKLSELPVHHRMAYVRLFVGGRVVYKPKGFSNTVERDLELTLFD
jgi:tetratricopeptide (TPR) repeat protein